MLSFQISQPTESACVRRCDPSIRLPSDPDLLVGLLEVCRQVADPRESVRMALGAHGRVADLVDGAGASDAAVLMTVVRVAKELARRVAADQAARRRVARPADVAAVATCELAGAERERLLLLVCDAGNKLLHTTVIAEGTADRLLIPVREILTYVLQHGGRGFALAHNHPSGDTTESQADVVGTRALANAARATELRFLGHVIVAGEAWQVVGSADRREGGVDG